MNNKNASHLLPPEKGGLLSINLEAIQKNYMLMRQKSHPARAAVVLKANAYGLGLKEISEALFAVGTEDYFVTTIDEGIILRDVLPSAQIYILNGVFKGTEEILQEKNLIPVLLSQEQVSLWKEHALKIGKKCKAILQVDTGMGRFGLSYEEAMALSQDIKGLAGIDLVYVLSHLSSATLSSHPNNPKELEKFKQVLKFFPKVPATLANSPGILLGSDYHFNMTRMGIALYGGAPCEDLPNLLAPVLSLKAKVIQVRSLKKDMPVGYDGTYVMPQDGRIATVNIGFADGFLRSLSNRGYGLIEGHKVPIVGIISMDWMSIDVTEVPESLIYPGSFITLLGESLTIDHVAKLGNTTSYDLISGLGSRFHRYYEN